jgi:FkbM family methyltransferase
MLLSPPFFWLFLLTCLSTKGMANSFRGMLSNDPKTIVEKETDDDNENEACPSSSTTTTKPDFNVPFRSQYIEDQIIYEKFYSSRKNHKICHGVVLEIGGLDGLFVSNSWFFQYGLHWKTILVEANPTMYEQMTKNRPDAINIWKAICWGDTAKFQISDMEATDRLVDEMSIANKDAAIGNDHIIDVPCSTLASLLEQHQIRHIDVFFLDVEGAELLVLETIDWDKVQIDILVVEMSYGSDLTKNDKIRNLLYPMGYKTPFSMHELCIENHKLNGKESVGCMPSDVFVRDEVWASIQQ